MTEDNRDNPQPRKTKSNTGAKDKSAPVNPGTSADNLPAPAKPRARKPATPKTTSTDAVSSKSSAITKPGSAEPKAASPKRASSKTGASAANSVPLTTAASKPGLPKADAPKKIKVAKEKTTQRASSTLDRPAGVSDIHPVEPPPRVVAERTVARPRQETQVVAAPDSAAPMMQVAPLRQPEIMPPTLHSATPVKAGKKPVSRLSVYWQLTRMHKPIGALLLLWPTLWALWLAAKGMPRWDLLIIFVLGVFVMRSAGCVINDFADRKIDGRVKRTKDRPLAAGLVSSGEAIGLFLVLCLVAFGLVLLTDKLTIQLSVGGLILAFCYPFMKRHTHLPQVVLGAAFAWSVPMAFAAQSGNLGAEVWLLYTTVVLWTVVYDTFYAMVDRDDDRRIGVKSTAILFGEQDRMMTGVLQALMLYGLVMVGSRFELGIYYYAGVIVAAGFFAYQQYLIRFRARDACFKAFLNNNWVGVAVFVGIVLDYQL